MTHPVLVCSLLTLVSACGQSLQVTPVSGAPGGTISIDLSLDAPADRKPSALQWELIFPAQLLELSKPPADPGPAVQGSGKTLTCASRNDYTEVCILAGGSGTIPNGSIATIHLKVRTEAKPGTTTVKFTKVQGVTSDLRPLPFKDLDAVITIR